jgi:hypothetical protein
MIDDSSVKAPETGRTVGRTPDTPFLDRGVRDWSDRLMGVPFTTFGVLFSIVWSEVGLDRSNELLAGTISFVAATTVILFVVAMRRGATIGEALGVILIGRFLYRWIFARNRRAVLLGAADSDS